jgi:hypothetical protein
MKSKGLITTLVVFIVLLSLLASVLGLLPGDGEAYEVNTVRGATVTVAGSGLYRYDSVGSAAQAKGQDLVTLILALPLLVLSLIWARRGSLKGRLLLTGTVGYFLYTYASYTFLAMYNPLFLVYVAIMSLSFFGFVSLFMSFDRERLQSSFDKKFPARTIGGILIFIGAATLLMWLGRIVPALVSGGEPVGIDHYTTLVIQALDLGFIVPAAFLAGVSLIRSKPLGYLLAPVLILKAASLLAAITAMAVMTILSGLNVSYAELVVFLVFDILIVICLTQVLHNIRETHSGEIADPS